MEVFLCGLPPIGRNKIFLSSRNTQSRLEGFKGFLLRHILRVRHFGHLSWKCEVSKHHQRREQAFYEVSIMTRQYVTWPHTAWELGAFQCYQCLNRIITAPDFTRLYAHQACFPCCCKFPWLLVVPASLFSCDDHFCLQQFEPHSPLAQYGRQVLLSQSASSYIFIFTEVGGFLCGGA